LQGFEIPIAGGGTDVCRAVVETNAEESVTCVYSYVSADKLHDVLPLRRSHAGGDPERSHAERARRSIGSRGSRYSTATSAGEEGDAQMRRLALAHVGALLDVIPSGAARRGLVVCGPVTGLRKDDWRS
jgi:hypothetical protein